MSAEGPRHRERSSELTRRAEQKILGSFIAMTFMIAFLICFAVATDNVLLVTVSSIGAVIGVWLGRGRSGPGSTLPADELGLRRSVR